ncbi:MAG: hypothetical protein AAF726_13140 [Planctomycetota bacterium]
MNLIVRLPSVLFLLTLAVPAAFFETGGSLAGSPFEGTSLLSLALPAACVALLAFLSVSAATGVGAAIAGLGLILGGDPSPGRIRALIMLARTVVRAGLLLSLLGAFSMFIVRPAAFGQLATESAAALESTDVHHWTLGTASAGLVLGRLILAPCADREAARTGLDARAFRTGEDVGLFVLVIPFLLSQLTLFVG